VNQEPGYQVLSRKYQDDLLTLEVLRSAMSVPQNDLIDTLKPSKYEIVFNEKIASIDDPEIYLPYLSSKYQANLSVERGEQNKLIILGEITEDNLARLMQDSLANSVFSVEKSPKLIIKPSLSVQQKSRSEFVDLVQSINSQLYYFQVASAELTEESQNLLNQNITKIRRILDLQNQAETTIIQIGIFGFADPQGSRTTNIDLSQQRAKLIKSILLENEISDSLVISWGGGAIDMSSVPSQYQRRARIEILYELKGATSHAQ
jgi:outer membrane protein OmpA-like peptidoglycan-associated protein